MMKRLFYMAALSLPLLFAVSCRDNEEMDVPDIRILQYSLEVTNDSYTATTVLDGIGNTKIQNILNQPSWVSEVKREDKLLDGSMVLAVTVKGDPALDDVRKANMTIEMANGATAVLELSQRAGLPVGFNDGESPSLNKEFEEKWWEAKNIQLVTSVQTINGREQVITESIPLPWNYSDPGRKNNVPDEDLENMLHNKTQWIMAFNTTGIPTTSCVNMNYFGLYNVSTGRMRVFYYWPAPLIPESGANDHMWYVRFKGTQADHNSTQFAIPINHKIDKGTAAYKAFEERAGTYYTTASTGGFTDQQRTVIVPKVGWWAFEVELSAMRGGSLFDDYQNIAIGMDLFDSQDIVLSSILSGKITGDLNGSMNLSKLIPSSTNDWGKCVPTILSAFTSFATNKFVLDYFYGKAGNNQNGQNGENNAPRRAPLRALGWNPGWGVALVGASSLITMVGNLVKDYAKDSPASAEEKEKFGQLNITADLSLNATMTTKGLIRSQRSHKVPEVSLPAEYLKNLAGTSTRSDTPQLDVSRGLWNISNDPVVYIVKDAYWANKPQATYYSRKDVDWYRQGREVAEYDISMSPATLGMRLISFFDPTSIGDVVINEEIFGKPTQVYVDVNCGVYPGSEAGYTDTFRSATSLDYDPMTISTKDKQGKVSTGAVAGAAKAPFQVFKEPYTSSEIVPELQGNNYPETIANRLSNQEVGSYERRYYGLSMFYSNPKATYSTVDEVQFVANPQIFLPFDEKRRVITDPDIPDLVVSVHIAFLSQGPLDDEPTWKTYTLRYLPKVEYIKASEVEGVVNQIASKPNGGLPSPYTYNSYAPLLSIAQAYSSEISSKL